MANDRITEVRIQGLRTLADVRLKLGGLTVLVGENGSGKSSILEAFEILRKATEPGFLGQLGRVHGGLTNLLRVGADRLVFSVQADGGDDRLFYTFELTHEGGTPVIAFEGLRAEFGGQPSTPLFERRYGKGVSFARALREQRLWDPVRGGPRLSEVVDSDDPNASMEFTVSPDTLCLRSAVISSGTLRMARQHGFPDETTTDGRMATLLARAHVQFPLAVRPAWVGKETGERFSLRDPSMIAPAPSLARSSENLANCYHALKNEASAEEWEQTLDLVRLGLGDEVETVSTVPSSSGGAISISLKMRGWQRSIYADALSDGQLAYLAYVALARVPGEPSLIAIDEPEAHLHPHLLVRVLEMLETLAERSPVVLATHSDRLLDALPDPATSVVLCELNQERATVLRRPNAEALARWLEHYRGIGDMRAEGVDKLVVTERD